MVSAIILLVVTQATGSDQAGCAKELAINIKRGASIAEYLTTHSAMVSAAIHCKRLLTTITNLTESIRHPEFVLWCCLFDLFFANLRFGGSYIFRINKDRQ